MKMLVILLPSMARIKDEDLESAMKAIKLLYQTGGQTGCSREAYFEALERMREDGKLHPGLEGCIHGILFGCGREEAYEAEAAGRGYIYRNQRAASLKTAVFSQRPFFSQLEISFLWGRA